MNFDNDDQLLRMWTVYRSPLDYPGKFVVRCSHAKAGRVLNAVTPTAVVDSLAEARHAAQQAAGYVLTQIPRHPSDDPVIVEVWL